MQSIEKLQEELARAQNLLKQKAILQHSLQEIDKDLNKIFSQANQTKTGRNSKTRTQNLSHYVSKAMAPGAHMTPKQIADKVIELGYQTTNKQFDSYLSTRQLSKRADIKKIKFGVYCRMATLHQNGVDDAK